MNSPQDPSTELKQLPVVQEYLHIAGSKIRSRALKQQIDAEILSHIEAFLQEHRDDSAPLAEVVRAALASLGDAQELRRGFFEANLPYYFRRRFYLPIAGVAAVLAMFVGAVEYYSHRAQSLLLARVAQIDASLVAFLDDDQAIAALDIFKSRVSGRDFGPVINPQIAWSTPDVANSAPRIAVPKALAEQLSFLGNDWLVERDQVDVNSVDLTWMDQLNNFDIWDLYQTGPAATFTRQTELNPFAIPTPDYVSLSGFAKLALIEGVKTGALNNAMSRVEQLARLIYSNETLIGGIIAVSFLEANAEVYAFGQEQGLLKPEFRLQYSAETLAKFKRIMLARANYFDFANSKEALSAAFPVVPNLESSPGVCQALDEGIRSMTVYHQFFVGRFPYEASHSKNIADIDAVMEQSKGVCRIGPARFFWRHRDDVPDLSTALSVSFDPMRGTILAIAAQVPYARQAVGVMLMAVARPIFSGY